MNLIIDNGNTFLKTGLFEQGQFVLGMNSIHSESAKIINEIQSYSIDAAILSSVAELPSDIEDYLNSLPFYVSLNSSTALPIEIDYLTPETLGTDRIANAVGAYEMFKGKNMLIIDAGTCLKFDFVDKEGVYRGGAISPGLLMRYNALHHYTDRLPLLEPESDEEIPLTGRDTKGSIHSGVINGMRGEILSAMHDYEKKYGSVQKILTGGDSRYFLNMLKTYIFAAPTLTLQGLDAILRHNQ